MKAKELAIFGFLFQFLGTFFISLYTSHSFSEIYAALVWAFYGIAVIFWIMAIICWLEKRSEQKSITNGKLVDIVLDGRSAKDKEQLIKVADELGLQQIPNDFYELAFYAKKVGKEKEAKKAVDKWVEEGAKWHVYDAPKEFKRLENLKPKEVFNNLEKMIKREQKRKKM